MNQVMPPMGPKGRPATPPAQQVTGQYRTALLAYLAQADEDGLNSSYELARVALESDLPLSAFSGVHLETVRQLMSSQPELDPNGARGDDFWLEFETVFDMALKGYRTIVPLLRQEISERQRAEQQLRAATYDLMTERDSLDAKVLDRTRELERQARDLEATLAQLRQTNREQAEFTYAISHDLKSPNNTMLMLIEELRISQDGRLDEDGQNLLALMAQTSCRLAQIVEDVLTYSRCVETQEPHAPVQLNAVLDEIMADLRFDFEKAAASVKFPDIPAVMGDRLQLRLLLQNLLANAVKFRHAGRAPQIAITVKFQGSDRVLLSVRDNGIGIESQYLTRIFGLFQRLHTHETYEGSGIGLTLCQRIASNHGGDIRVVSQPGFGTSFTVSLIRYVP